MSLISMENTPVLYVEWLFVFTSIYITVFDKVKITFSPSGSIVISSLDPLIV